MGSWAANYIVVGRVEMGLSDSESRDASSLRQTTSSGKKSDR